MADDKLNAGQRWALLTLMALDGEAANTQLRDTVGFTLTGKDRVGLTDLKLITSEKHGSHGEFRHTLTEEGWAWCTAELAAHYPEGANPAGRVMYAVLHLWQRFLDNSDMQLIDFSSRATTTPRSRPVDLAGQIRLAYRKLAEQPGDWVRLNELRAELVPAERTDVDRTLVQLSRTDRVFIVPESNQQALTAADRKAAVRIGGQDSHLISIED